MNFERFVALRLTKARRLAQRNDDTGTRPIIRIAVAGIAIGIAVMIISVAVLVGFQEKIREKVIGFGGHINITAFQTNAGFDSRPLMIDQPFYPSLNEVDGVKNIHVYANKVGILKSSDEIYGIVLKGVSEDFDWSFFETNLVEGHLPSFSKGQRSDSVVISQEIARKMGMSAGDPILVYFVQNNKPRPRKFVVSGIYHTGLANFDEKMIIGDIGHLQRILGWTENQVGGFEVVLNKFEDLDKMDDIIYESIGYQYNSSTIKQRHPDIFGWLGLQDMNVIIIIALMILVCGVNMTSALLIMILDKTQMIGTMKAMGATNWSIQKIFLHQAALLIGSGLVWGNIIGIGLCVLQQQTGFVTLDQSTYYLDQVPILLDPVHIILLDVGTLLLCLAVLVLPSYFVTRINPIQAIRFD